MKQFKWLSFIFIGCIIFMAACSQGKNVELNLAEVTRSVFYTPQYVALEKGFFEEEGLSVQLQTTWGGDKTMTALLSDHADIALVGSETSIYVHAQDATDPVINFAQLTQTDGTFLVAKTSMPEFQWEDVKDDIFLGQRKGGMPQMVGEYVLKKYGIDPHRDLELIQNIEFANIPGAFASGDAQYVQLFEPTATVFEQEGKGHVIASFGEESGFLPYTVFMTKNSFIEEERETVEKFTRAIYKAQQWVYETDSTEIAEAVQPFFDDVELDILAASIERYKTQDSFAPSPLLAEKDWENLLDIMDEADELPGEAPYDVLVNTDIANKIIDEVDGKKE